MNSKKLCFGVAIATMAVAGSLVSASSAEALVIGGNAHYSPLVGLPTTLTVDGEFDNSDLTGGFTKVLGLRVNSLLIKAGGSYDATSNFLSNFKYAGVDAVFNLFEDNSLLHTSTTVGDFISTSTVEPEFFGEIRSVLGNKLLATAFGGFSAGETMRGGTLISSNFSLDLTATAVPTPALLPGLLGMGVAALRRRKNEETQAETVEAEA
ncbi:MAG TPA: PTPA-CTERM sorting domain-containing protein [Trichocoleus sp.]|jgi:hypothetical protein